MRVQPACGSQPSAVHGLPSSQGSAAPGRQLPPAQLSATVQTLPSEHGVAALASVQPVSGSQPSVVHGLPSLQTRAVGPLQPSGPQTSFWVHASPSSHGAVVGLDTQPCTGSQLSAVHGSLSLQTVEVPGAHRPTEQVSPLVQALLSEQGALLAVNVQPSAKSHASSVQGLASLHGRAAPPTHLPAAHVSAVVHASPSEHGAALTLCTQPLSGSQLSAVHGLASSQPTAVPVRQAPP